MPNCERAGAVSPEEQSATELAWLRENLAAFWTKAYTGYCDDGRGTIVIDATAGPLEEDTPFYYALQASIAEQEDEVSQQLAGLISDYEPDRQFVAVCMRPGADEVEFSMFQIGVREQLAEAAHTYHLPAEQTAPSEAEPELEMPNLETLMAWDDEGGCEAACPHSCWVEPDGVCEHGHQSWLLVLGLI